MTEKKPAGLRIPSRLGRRGRRAAASEPPGPSRDAAGSAALPGATPGGEADAPAPAETARPDVSVIPPDATGGASSDVPAAPATAGPAATQVTPEPADAPDSPVTGVAVPPPVDASGSEEAARASADLPPAGTQVAPVPPPPEPPVPAGQAGPSGGDALPPPPPPPPPPVTAAGASAPAESRARSEVPAPTGSSAPAESQARSQVHVPAEVSARAESEPGPPPSPGDPGGVGEAGPGDEGGRSDAVLAGVATLPRYDDDYGTAAPPRPQPGEQALVPAPAPTRARRRRPADGHRGVDVALRTLVVPDHADGFWEDIAQRLADEPQLRLRPRSAVRPITEPPPISDDRPVPDGAYPSPQRRRRRRLRTLVLVGVLVTAAVVGAGAYQESTMTEDGPGDAATTTTVPPPTAPGLTTLPPPPFDAAAPLRPSGVEHLAVGMPLGELTASGLVIQVDRPTFTGSGGTCYDARLAGADDLFLRFRSPDPAAGVTDEAQGILASVSIGARAAGFRSTEAGIGLGATEDQVRAAHPQGLTEGDHPVVPGDRVLTFDPGDGSGNGIAFRTHAGTVSSITVGALRTIAAPEGCG